MSIQRRRVQERRAAALARLAAPESDFLPLEPSAGGAWPSTSRTESSLPREEEEIGMGEDDYAEYTGATERVPLGRDAERRRKIERRRQMRTLINAVEGGDEDDDDIAIVVRQPRSRAPAATPSSATLIHDEDAFAMHPDALPAAAPMDEDEDEDEDASHAAWEHAQMQRTGVAQPPAPASPERARPARVPLVTALPTPTSCLARLDARIHALDERAAEHRRLAEQAESSSQALVDEETSVRAEVGELESKAAWFSELESFVETVAAFLDTKMPLLDTLEHNALSLLVDRCLSRQRARAQALEDDVALVHGVARVPLMPSSGADEALPMTHGGAWNSAAREQRRRDAPATLPPDSCEQWLSAEQQRQFAAAKAQLQEQHHELLLDVHAPEFRDPAADVPESLVARFESWRRQFRKEYDLAWGGLALANAWDFWARYELVLWDPLWCMAAHGDVRLGGPRTGLDGFGWEHALQLYVERADPPRGGDDEALATLVSTAVIPRLLGMAEHGAYDPYSVQETQSLLFLVEQISYVLDVTQWRFQSLLRAFVQVLQRHSDVLCDALQAPVVLPGAPVHPDRVPAQQRIADTLGQLAGNVLRWGIHWVGPHAPPWSAEDRGMYVAVADRVLSRTCAELRHAEHQAALAETLVRAWPDEELCPDLRREIQAWRA